MPNCFDHFDGYNTIELTAEITVVLFDYGNAIGSSYIFDSFRAYLYCCSEIVVAVSLAPVLSASRAANPPHPHQFLKHDVGSILS